MSGDFPEYESSWRGWTIERLMVKGPYVIKPRVVGWRATNQMTLKTIVKKTKKELIDEIWADSKAKPSELVIQRIKEEVEFAKKVEEPKRATRSEQHERYLDCGYQNWDDRGD